MLLQIMIIIIIIHKEYYTPVNQCRQTSCNRRKNARSGIFELAETKHGAMLFHLHVYQ